MMPESSRPMEGPATLPRGVVRAAPEPPYFVVLGTAQDGGYPQAGCRRPCCAAAWADPTRRRLVASAAVVVPTTPGRAPRRWLIDATPDLGAQLHALDELAPPDADAAAPALAGILMTHGHVGHILGLALLGREGMGARRVPVHAMPDLLERLATQDPWRALVEHGHVVLRPLHDGTAVPLGGGVTAWPERVPHRDEMGETVGFRIAGPERAVRYLPDIDGWDAPLDGAPAPALAARLADVDVAYLDGTFHDADELPGRDRALIPHPTIRDTLTRLADAPEALRRTLRFTHLNHSNAVLDPDGPARAAVRRAGADVADDGECVPL